jgi:Ni,Fe-hydrogenase III small subunit
VFPIKSEHLQIGKIPGILLLVGECNCTCAIFNQTIIYLGKLASTYSCPNHPYLQLHAITTLLSSCSSMVQKKIKKEERTIWCYHGREFEPVWLWSVQQFP